MPAPQSSPPANAAVLLRTLSILTFPPALILLVIHGLVSKYAFPAVGLLALAPSSLLGAMLLHRDKVAAFGSPVQALSPSNVFFADVTLAFFLLAMLIPSWIFLDEPYEGGQIVLGTYGTVFMMINLGIHAYFALKQLVHVFAARSCDCAHCQSVSRHVTLASMASEYTPLSEADAEQGYTDRDIESVNDDTGV